MSTAELGNKNSPLLGLPKINPDEKKDLDKFTKFLALKAAQIIVQSRLGEKVHTQCKPQSSGKDWFNLVITDLPDVLTEAKKACESATTRLTLCVEISLRTVEGDTMMLETWNLGVLPDECDSTARVTHTVYNRMGLLLKSLVTVTRVTPAYKLSRRQSPDSYVICYRIYMGDPQLQYLGEGYRQVRVGQLCTPIGTIQLSVSYRTKMTISPQSKEKDSSIMLKSDHFAPKSNSEANDDLDSSMTETLKVGAFADVPTNKTEVDERLLIPDTPFTSLLAPKASPPNFSAVLSPEKQLKKEAKPEIENTINTDGNGNITPKATSRADSRRSSCSFVSAPDDFFLIDFKTPFANPNANADLGNFYRECQQAPPLHEFEEEPENSEAITELTKQLEDFEMSAPKYEKLLSALNTGDNI